MTDNTFQQAKEESEQLVVNGFKRILQHDVDMIIETINLKLNELSVKHDQTACIIIQINKRIEKLQQRLDFLEDKFHNHTMEIDAHNEPIRKEKLK